VEGIDMRRNKILGGLLGTAAALMVAASALSDPGLDSKAQWCDDFFHNVIVGAKIDQAAKYLTEDFKEHNLRLAAEGLPDFITKFKAMRANTAARPVGAGAGGTAPPRTVLTQGNLVVFILFRPSRSDPNAPGQMLPASTHFDVYRLRDGKIAEHWD
jgi:predicted SnoaL-like aldol condensation-catalyzing enzyme